MHIDCERAASGVRRVSGSAALARSRIALLAGASLALALMLGSPGQALAACGGSLASGGGAHAPSSGGGGVFRSAHGAGASAGVSSCGVNAHTGAAAGGLGAGSLAGIHVDTSIRGNGSRNKGSGTHTASNGARFHALHAGTSGNARP